MPMSTPSHISPEAAQSDQGVESMLSVRAAKADAMRTSLLNAAEMLYAREGSAALTNRRITTEAATTTQSIYTYFGSRESLVAAMYTRAIEGVEEIIADATAIAEERRTTDTVIDAFKDVARAYRQYCLQHPGRFRIIRVADDDPGAPAEATALRQRIVDALVAFGRSSGEWSEEYYESRSRLTVAAVHGFILAEIESFITESDDPDRLYDELVHRCLVRFEEIADL
jgi:AcrR family transcriptional regulator